METVFEALPGMEAPVGAISKSLAAMWRDSASRGRAAPASDDAKATQVNFVLHLGFNTTAGDAVVTFQTAVEFSRRYPSRVVVLCPMPDAGETTEMRAKVYGECTLGKSKGDTRCCEFVMLSYSRKARAFLENQVSLCLSTDLPLYYWAHRFSASVRLADYQYLLTRSRRMLIDSAIAPEDALTYRWPRPGILRDLAYARLLPVRQSLGQFLSRYAMDVLCAGLMQVTVTHTPGLAAEGRVLLGWARDRIGKCGQNRATFGTVMAPADAGQRLSMNFAYSGSRSFSWKADLAAGTAEFNADLGSGVSSLRAPIGLLPPAGALAEAMFF